MPDIYKEYEPDTLAHLQKVELSILKDFDDVCRENNIEYFALAGTAIGAVRHGGFIPWDDDIDVGLLRKDYEKVIKCFSQKLNDKYDILNTEYDHDYPLMTTRIVLKGTRFQEECFSTLKGNYGIFLDVYCFDYVPDDNRKMNSEAKKVWVLGKLMILTQIGIPVLYINGIKKKVVLLCCKCLHSLFKLLRLSPYSFYKKIREELKKNEKPSQRVSYQFETEMYASLIDVKDIFPTKKVSFEGLHIPIPSNYDKILTKMYGDYMKLPPVEKRHNHPPYYLDFGTY